MNAIKCTQCGHENDLTRVFCQNCGTRLERPKGMGGPTISGPSKVPTGPRKLKSGMSLGAALGKVVRAVISTIIIAALIALLIQMSRKPEGLPEPRPANDVVATQNFQMLNTMAESPYTTAFDLKQDQINNYLAARIIAGPAPEGATIRAQFQRAFVILGTGEATFYVEQKFLGLPVYMSITGAPVSEGKTTTFRTTGAAVGHVKLPAQLAPLVEKVVGPVVTSVSEAVEVLKNASSITVDPGVAKLSWAGKKPAGN